MSQQHAAWEVRLDRDGHVLPQVPPDQPGDDGGGRYLVVPQHDGSLDLLALEVFAQRQEPSAQASAGDDEQLIATDPSRYGRRALGDLTEDPAAALPLPVHAGFLVIDPRQPDLPQPQAIQSSSPEAVHSAVSPSVSEWTYWLTQNRDARMWYRQQHESPTGLTSSSPCSASGRAPAASRPSTPSTP
jgi:hypothetical protein